MSTPPAIAMRRIAARLLRVCSMQPVSVLALVVESAEGRPLYPLLEIE
jgi:hypothetical protein